MIAEITHDMYSAFGDYQGEDFALHRFAPEQYNVRRDYFGDMAEAQARVGEPSYDGVLEAAHYAALAESDPSLKIDALLRLAATALSFAAAVEDQALAADEEE